MANRKSKLPTMLALTLVQLTVALGASIGAAQPPTKVVVAGAPSCATCTIELRKIVTLGSDTEDGRLNWGPIPVRDSRGRYYVSGFNDWQIVIFDSTGRKIGVIGTQGTGPGELGHVAAFAVDDGDSLHVFQTGRQSVFAPDGRFVRSSTIPGAVYGFALLKDNSFIYATNVFHLPRSVATFPAVAVSPQGKALAPIGTPLPVQGVCANCTLKTITASAAGSGVLMSPRNRYLIETWTPDGRVTGSVEVRDSPWYHDWEEQTVAQVRAVGNQPGTHIIALSSSVDSLIWVAGRVPDPRPNNANLRPSSLLLTRQQADSIDALNETLKFATVLELLNLSSRSVTVSARFEHRAIGLMANGLAYEHRKTANGYILIDIYQLVIVRR